MTNKWLMIVFIIVVFGAIELLPTTSDKLIAFGIALVIGILGLIFDKPKKRK